VGIEGVSATMECAPHLNYGLRPRIIYSTQRNSSHKWTVLLGAISAVPLRLTMVIPYELDILMGRAQWPHSQQVTWNQWRAENPTTQPDLSEADLKEADLHGVAD
jgi:hypothetical protein